MKLVKIVIYVGLLSNIAYAKSTINQDIINNFMRSIMKSKTELKKMEGDPIGRLMPIRQAKAKFLIIKQKIIKKGTHFDYDTKVVCEMTGNIPVFDFRNTSDVMDRNSVPLFSCPTTLGQDSITVNFRSIAGLENFGPIFSDEPSFDVKSFYANFYLSGNKISDERFKSNKISTRDLLSTSIIFDLLPEAPIKCDDQDNCEIIYPESFSAIIDIQDNL